MVIVRQILGLAAAIGLAIALISLAGSPSLQEPAERGIAPEGPAGPSLAHYIVVLDDAPLATYAGGLPGLPATAVQDGAGPHLDLDTAAAQAYIAYLDARIDAAFRRVLARAPEAELGWRYRYALAGFSVELRPEQAVGISSLPGILSITREERLEPELDGSAQVINLGAGWAAAGGPEEAGAGARIAIMDTGGDPGHPMFSDAGFPEPPEGFPSALLIGRDGELAYPDLSDLTNNKVIGTRAFAKAATEENLSAPEVHPLVYRNIWGSHGLHVGGIAAGSRGTYTYTFAGQSVEVELSGVAPQAHVFIYHNNDNTPGFVAAYEQMIEDRIDAVNISLGHSGWHVAPPGTHPISLAIQGGAAAGIVTVTSAGNAGNWGLQTHTGTWKLIDEAISVANTSSSAMPGVAAEVSGEGRPDALPDALVFTPLTSPLPEAVLTAPLHLFEGGKDCSTGEVPAGSIVVVDYEEDDYFSGDGLGRFFGCGNHLNEQGALAAVLYMPSFRRVPSFFVFGGLPIPMLGIGQDDGQVLVDWLRGGGAGQIALDPRVIRAYVDEPDILSDDSTRGPDIHWGIKPDISAPGTNILSAVASLPQNQTVPRRSLSSISGTSMASPHVAGAAALIRGKQPDWTAKQVRAALLGSSDPVVQVPDAESEDGHRPALPYEAGAGRLDLRHALDPGVHIDPPKLSFGRMRLGETKTISLSLESLAETPITWEIDAEEGQARIQTRTRPLTLEAGAQTRMSVDLEIPRALPQQVSDHHGRVILSEQGGERRISIPFYARVDTRRPADVLLINWTYGDTEDYSTAYTEALDSLGLSYTLWNMGDAEDGLLDPKADHPSLDEMQRHALVIFNANMSPSSMHFHGSNHYAYMNYLHAGGNLLISGQGTQGWWRFLGRSQVPENLRAELPDSFPYVWSGPGQNSGCEMCLARYFAGFTPALTATLSGELLVPFPRRPEEPEREVILAPHPEADGPFQYALDISTGAEAPDGAAGNQYRFSSGGLIEGYRESGNEQITAEQGDIPYAETVLDAIVPLARPMWQFEPESEEADPLTVGTYVLGRAEPEAEVPWNAMYWGFGLEGLGTLGAEWFDPGQRNRTLADAYNLLAHNLEAEAGARGYPWGTVYFQFEAGPGAAPVMVERASLAYQKEGSPIVVTFDNTFEPQPLEGFELTLPFAESGRYAVGLRLEASAGPDAASVAPISRIFELDLVHRPTIHLPILNPAR